jgi:hypothetical protein
MSALTDRLREGVDPPEDSEVADRIDFLEPELERFKRLLDDEHAKHMAALIRLHAIDAVVSDEWRTDSSKIISIYRLLHPEE